MWEREFWANTDSVVINILFLLEAGRWCGKENVNESNNNDEKGDAIGDYHDDNFDTGDDGDADEDGADGGEGKKVAKKAHGGVC